MGERDNSEPDESLRLGLVRDKPSNPSATSIESNRQVTQRDRASDHEEGCVGGGVGGRKENEEGCWSYLSLAYQVWRRRHLGVWTHPPRRVWVDPPTSLSLPLSGRNRNNYDATSRLPSRSFFIGRSTLMDERRSRSEVRLKIQIPSYPTILLSQLLWWWIWIFDLSLLHF